jgi:hypothetical protein
MTSLSSQQLRQAAALKEKIAGLEKKLGQLLGGPAPASAAAQKARWAKVKSPSPAARSAARPLAKSKRQMSAAAKARLSRLAKARWAKVKESGGKKL